MKKIHLCQSFFFNKVADLRLPVNFCEISKNSFSYRTPLMAPSVAKSCMLDLRMRRKYASNWSVAFRKKPLGKLCSFKLDPVQVNS